jgi:hypothetical protein
MLRATKAMIGERPLCTQRACALFEGDDRAIMAQNQVPILNH